MALKSKLKIIKWSLGVFLLLLFVLAMVPAPEQPVSETTDVQHNEPEWTPSSELLDALHFQSLIEQGFKIELYKFEESALNARMTIPESEPITSYKIEEFALEIISASVKTLVKHGHNPRQKEMLIVYHFYQNAGLSDTGGNLVRYFGFASYSPTTDSYSWKPENR